jgi:hypothetical protein
MESERWRIQVEVLPLGILSLSSQRVESGQHGSKTTEYKSTDSPLPPLLNVMYYVRVTVKIFLAQHSKEWRSWIISIYLWMGRIAVGQKALNLTIGRAMKTALTRVPDQEPDPGSVSFWASRIRIRIRNTGTTYQSSF